MAGAAVSAHLAVCACVVMMNCRLDKPEFTLTLKFGVSNAYGLGAIVSGPRAVIHVRIATQRGLSAPILEAHVHSAGQSYLHDGGDWRCRSPMSWRTVKVAPSSVVNHPVTKGCNLVTVPWVIERRKRDPGTKHTCQIIRPLLQALGLL